VKTYATLAEFCEIARCYVQMTDGTVSTSTQDYRKRAIAALSEWFPGNRRLRSLQPGELEKRLDALSDAIRKNLLGAFRFLFDTAAADGYLAANPLDALSAQKYSFHLRSITAPSTIAQFMAAAERFNPDLVAPSALKYFGGFTEQECLGLSWDNIDLARGLISVSMEKTRSTRGNAKPGAHRRSRTVGMASNLRLWLASIPGPKAGHLYPFGIRTLAAARTSLCGTAEITKNHHGVKPATWGSPASTYLHYRTPLAGVQALVETAFESLPHTPLQASIEECIAYWTIVPSGTDPAGVAEIKSAIEQQYLKQTAPGGAGARYLVQARREASEKAKRPVKQTGN